MSGGVLAECWWWQVLVARRPEVAKVAFQMAIHVQVCMPRTAVATRVKPAERLLCSFILVQSIIRLANKNVMPERKLQLYGAPFHLPRTGESSQPLPADPMHRIEPLVDEPLRR